MSGLDYVAAAMAPCPRCKARTGSPCVELACRHNYRNCQFKICSYWRERSEPHLERAVAARRATEAGQ